MKTLITLVMFTFLIVFAPEAHALFGHVQAEKERRQESEQRVIQEQQNNDRLLHSNQTLHTISILSAGVVISLIVGAAVGSKTRKDHES